MTTAQIIAALPTTCEKCGQAQVETTVYEDGQSWLMLRTGLLVCRPCFDAYNAAEREPQGETVRLFEPAPTQLPGQMFL